MTKNRISISHEAVILLIVSFGMLFLLIILWNIAAIFNSGELFIVFNFVWLGILALPFILKVDRTDRNETRRE